MANSTQLLDTPKSVESLEVRQEKRVRFWLPLLCILALAAAMYATFAVTWVKFSRAEVFFSECAREMIAQNNMVTPLYHSQPFFDKPIWAYWLIISMFKTFGVSHWAARVPSIIASICTIALTAFATRWVGTAYGASTEKRTTAGLLAAMFLAGSFMYFSFSYLCMSDMTLVLCDTITLALAYFGIVNERRRTLAWWLASVSMGFGFITKGPVGIVLPVLATLVYLGLTRQLKLVKPFHVLLGAITAVVIAFPWFFAAYKANGTWALAYFFIRENLIRYAGAMYDTHKPLWFMLTSVALGFCPWTPLIPFALTKQFGEMREAVARRVNDPKLFMWIWCGLLLGFFSFSRGKCDYYALPVYPALASLIALYAADKTDSRAMGIITKGFAVAALLAGTLSPFLFYTFSGHQPFTHWWIAPAAFVLTGALALVASVNKRIVASLTVLFAGFCISLSGFAAQIFPTLMDASSISEYARAIAQSPSYTTIGVDASLHHWVDELTFQSHREPIELKDSEAIAHLFAGGHAIALIPEDAFHKAMAESNVLAGLDLQILDRRRVNTHPLTPGYVLKRGGNILNETLLLISN